MFLMLYRNTCQPHSRSIKRHTVIQHRFNLGRIAQDLTINKIIGEGGRLPPTPRTETVWSGASLPSRGRRLLQAVRCLSFPVGYPFVPAELLCRHHTAVPRPRRVTGVQCQHDPRPTGNKSSDHGVNKIAGNVGHRAGKARAEPFKPSPTLPFRVAPRCHVSGSLQGRSGCTVRFSAPPRQ